MNVEEWDETHADEVAAWHYEPPCDFYDLASDPADEAAMRDPARADHHRAVLGDSGRLEAFCHLFVAAWNERAIRLYDRLGFHEVARETRHFELVGDHEFIRMERVA